MNHFKFLPLIIFLFSIYDSFAQNSFPPNGSVGIGTNAPVGMLEIKRMEIGTDYVGIIRDNNTTQLDFYSVYNGSSDIQTGAFAYGVRPVDDSWQIWERHTSTSWNNLLTIKANGNMGLGIINPNERLAVNGNIRAKEIKVEIQNWPDYVFEPAYTKRSLEDLETYLGEHRHLPDIPSAKEVEEYGVGLGEMNGRLLKKIEELTLYLIDQNREISEYKRSLEALKDEVNKLKSK